MLFPKNAPRTLLAIIVLLLSDKYSSLERMFSETEHHPSPSISDLINGNKAVSSESNYGSGGDDYKDPRWSRFNETCTYDMRTSVIGTTVNQMESTLNTMAGRVGTDIKPSRDIAVIVQIVANREKGISARDIYNGNDLLSII